MTLVTASLYLLCLAFLFGSAAFVYFRDMRSRLNGYYALLALSLLGWVGTLFVFGRLPEGNTLLLIGRANFAAAAAVAMASYLFVMELAGLPVRHHVWIFLETLALVLLSLFTPLVDQAETVRAGQHLTAYGPAFAAYIAHVVLYLGLAVARALRPQRKIGTEARAQLRLVGGGILATAIVGVTTNIVLPYAYGDFRFIDAGTLSTMLLLIAVSYAVFAHHLFNIRVIIRTTFVYAVLISLALEVYQASVAFLAELLPLGDPAARHFAATAIALAVNAATHEALRRWLERTVDRLILHQRPGNAVSHRQKSDT